MSFMDLTILVAKLKQLRVAGYIILNLAQPHHTSTLSSDSTSTSAATTLSLLNSAMFTLGCPCATNRLQPEHQVH